MEKKRFFLFSFFHKRLTAPSLEVDVQQPSRLFTGRSNAIDAAVGQDDITLTLSWHDNTALNGRNGHSSPLATFLELFLTGRNPERDQDQLESNGFS